MTYNLTNENPNYLKFGIHISNDHDEAGLVDCPACFGEHSPPAKTLSVYPSSGTWLCNHCAWRGKVDSGCSSQQPWLFTDPVLPIYRPKPLTKVAEGWFSKKGLSLDGATHFEFGITSTWNPYKRVLSDAITVPFKRDGILTNIKYRFGKNSGNSFTIGAEIIPFGMDQIDESCTIICANEIDLLYLYDIGYKNVISLPHGVPKLTKGRTGNISTNYHELHESLSFLDNTSIIDTFSKIKKVILCIGGGKDEQIITEELSRRIGREKCWTVSWSEDCKSVEKAFSESKQRLEIFILEAVAYPVKGVFELNDVKSQFDILYERGLPPGPTSGWSTMDDYYRPALGQWTLVTGIPSHGKSNFIDALTCNLAIEHGWKFCFFSPENQPVARHFASLSEKYIGAPFHPKSGAKAKMTVEEKKKSEKWLNNHFSIILPDEEEGNWSIDGVLELAKTVIKRKGVQGIVIDPWNEIDHSRPGNLSETEHTSQVISKIRQFARAHSVHIWLVAHPTKMRKDDNGQYPIPTPYDVAGSAHFLNKADMAICIYRYVGQVDQTITDIYIQKMRFKENGQVGRVSLRYIPDTGRFMDDIDQRARDGALSSSKIMPTDFYIRADKIKIPEFDDSFT